MPAATCANPVRFIRRNVLQWSFFLLALMGVCVAKNLHNQRQIEHVRARPLRVRAHFDLDRQAQREYWPVLSPLLGESLEQVQAKLDSGREITREAEWKLPIVKSRFSFTSFRDPSTSRVIELESSDGKLINSWVEPVPFVDVPIRFWDWGEGIRKSGGVIAAMLWLVCMIGAYKEPLLRRRLGQIGLGAAMVATACWWFEPPAGIRDAGLRLAHGPWVGLAMMVSTLPAFLLLLRKEVAGRCPHCHYDLTGNESGVCPECGHTTPAELVRRRRAKAAAFADAFERLETVSEIESTGGDERSPTLA